MYRGGGGGGGGGVVGGGRRQADASTTDTMDLTSNEEEGDGRRKITFEHMKTCSTQLVRSVSNKRIQHTNIK